MHRFDALCHCLQVCRAASRALIPISYEAAPMLIKSYRYGKLKLWESASTPNFSSALSPLNAAVCRLQKTLNILERNSERPAEGLC